MCFLYNAFKLDNLVLLSGTFFFFFYMNTGRDFIKPQSSPLLYNVIYEVAKKVIGIVIDHTTEWCIILLDCRNT